MKKLMALFLSSLMLLSAAACSNTPADDPADDTSSSAIENEAPADETESESETESEILPDIQAMDMGGKNFNVLITSWCDFAPLDITDIYAEDMTGELINDDTFERNLYMQDTYNCTVSMKDILNGQEIQEIQRANMAGDGTYDFAFIRGAEFASMMTQGLLLDLGQVPVVDYDKPWWNSNSYEQLAILGHHFGITSDLTVGDELAVWALFFNKSLIDEFSLDNPYELVKNGTWTYDILFAHATAVADDIDGDGNMTDTDRFGVSHIRDTTVGMWNTSGVYFAQINEEGVPEFTWLDEVSLTKMTNLLEKLYMQDICINAHVRCLTRGEFDMFMNNQTLYMFGGIYYASQLRDMENDFGILPYPKYDENQENYLSSTSGLFLPLMIIPKVHGDLNTLGTFLEAYAWYGYKYIRPDFYETLLQRKIARDEESMEMMDFLFSDENLIYDWGNITNLSGLSGDIIMLQNNYMSNLASYGQTRSKKDARAIAQLIEQIQNLDTAE